MAAGDLALNMLIRADSTSAGGVIANLGKSLSMLASSPMAAVGIAAAVTGAAIIGVGIAATSMASTYQQKMQSVQALNGLSTQSMQQYDAAVKQLAVDAGVGPADLTAGLNSVLGASYRGATAINVLTLATEDAKIGLTSAAITTDALTNVLRTFNVQASDVTRTNGEMLQTVTLGKSTFEQYASTIVKAASSASQFHVSMETMNAAWATMTSSGIRAAQASTDFQQSLKVMYGNIGSVTKSLHSNGIAFDEAKFNTMSYGDKVVYLNTALDKANAMHVKVTGVTLQAAQAIQAISKHIGDYNSNLASLSDKQAMAQKTSQAWAITQSGFAQTMSRANAAVQVLMIDIGQALLPVLTKLASQVTPLITQFTVWLTKSGALQAGVSFLVGTITFLVGTITNLVNTGTSIIGFFQNNQLAMDALIGILVGVGAGLLFIAITAIPPLLASFAMWGIAAIAVGIANIIAFWPILAIIAAVAIVVTVVILVMQHWGQIAGWLQGVWGGFSSWFMSTMGAIGGFFTGVWSGITSAFQVAVNFLVNIAKVGFQLWWAVVTFPITAVVAVFSWLYNHNYYFKDLVDAIVKFFKAGFAWLTGQWNAFVGWISGLWNGLVNTASSVFTNIKNVIQGKTTEAGNSLQTGWTNTSNFLQSNWGKFSGFMANAWSSVQIVVGYAWSKYIYPALLNLATQLVNWWNGWPSKMYQYGINMIQGFINGIGSMLGQVGQAAQNVMSTVGSFLGFHSPAAQGEGRHIVEWGTNMVKGFTQGIQAGMPLLNAQVSHMIQAPGSVAYGGSRAGNAIGGSEASSGSTSGPVTIIVMLDGRQIGMATAPHIVSEMRVRTGIKF
jgi:TP901 family phage tail tape measure protein